ncbi:MAG TPA: isoprenoid biosynthesis glyoxalase ElbB [Tenuifilaceae bacterium]|jgi:enhancing lycopene biosynthesis protein 2|nr:isoprenoid biosynthesis glyoxalase ElbB [Bacteroidales bacterium]HNY09680.1 isoprenoid biosynthesis glyoxalase ElbB [Tenuifilaceae bacterium]MBP8644256.1 isoprenoid biosynthesis glyoxalase ElbB [Bacteroidales bacterium]NLI87858.1 isoprenoid biosynthesis glyoxalase ElbB [Bacteroidales bacterium]HOA09595.1 isoprenoid biosynthesis glyoxalase ElbB [Tenuifilaceae bacterium]
MANSKKFAVVLSGCGVLDGSEIHEAVMTLYAITLSGSSYEIFAPDVNQHHVVNHLNGSEVDQTRNVLVESARIARGKIKPLGDFSSDVFDAIIFPGGFGVAKNLSSWAFDGAGCSVNADVANAVRSMHRLHKPIGALCIAPVVIARILGGVTVTIGKDAATVKEIETLGARHQMALQTQVVVDEKNMIFSTPCYMLDATIVDIAEGAKAIVSEMLKWI